MKLKITNMNTKTEGGVDLEKQWMNAEKELAEERRKRHELELEIVRLKGFGSTEGEEIREEWIQVCRFFFKEKDKGMMIDINGMADWWLGYFDKLLSSKAKEIEGRIGEDEKLPIMSEHTIESNKLLIEQVGARNAERKRIRSIVKEVLNNK